MSSYQVIARKYRPQRFEDVVGQEHVTRTLARAIEQNRIGHAYLFCGPRGTGKTTVARIFAKCLNATDGPRTDFRDDDPRCQEIAEGRSLDVLEIDAASNRGIDEVRALRETVRYAPAVARFKIYIVDEVHMLTKEAFNALLKTLEEPPAHVKFFFATTDPEKVLPTILSRCQRFDFRRIPVPLIVAHLAKIARQENVTIDDAALRAIARGADGGMRDAESALDQLISFCGAQIAEADVLSMFGLTAQAQILTLAQAILRGDAATALRELDELCQHGKDLGRLLADLLAHFRNLLVFQVTRGDMKLLEVSEAEAAALKEESALVRPEALGRILDVLNEAESQLRYAAAKKICFEVALVKAIEARNAVSLDALLQQLIQLRAAADPAAAAPAPEAPAPAPEPVPAPTPSGNNAPEPPPPAPVRAPTGNAELDRLWPELLDGLGRATPLLRSTLVGAFPVSLANGVLTIGFDPEFAHQVPLADTQRNRTLVATKMRELGCGVSQVKFVVQEAPAHVSEASNRSRVASNAPPAAAEAPAAPPAQRPSALSFDPKSFKNDPLIQKALDIFKGRIVDVRS